MVADVQGEIIDINESINVVVAKLTLKQANELKRYPGVKYVELKSKGLKHLNKKGDIYEKIFFSINATNYSIWFYS